MVTKHLRCLIITIVLFSGTLLSKTGSAQCPVVITSITTTGTTCNGQSDGTITVNINGGFAPYSYTVILGAFNQSFQTNNTTFTFTGLQAASNYVVVVDADADGDPGTPGGCSGVFQTNVIVPDAPALNVSVNTTPILCAGQSTGTATAVVSGGTGSYSFSWNTNPVQSTQTINNLATGNYTVTVTDGNGCQNSATGTVNNTNPIVIQSSASNTSCNGSSDGAISTVVSGGTAPYSFSWNTIPPTLSQNLNNVPAGSYTLTVTDANNCVLTSTSVVNQPQPLTIILTPTQVSCNGGNNGSITSLVSGGTIPYDFSWNTIPIQTTANISGLSAGAYTLTVTDDNGCQQIASTQISQPSQLSATATGSNILCNGSSTGTATVNPTGGISPYTFVWNSAPPQSTQTATNLSAGTYQVTVTDANLCSTTASATVTQNNAIVLIPSTTNVTCFGGNDGSATVLVSGGTAPISVVWNTQPAQSGTVAVNLTAGQYTATATDANGCVRSTTVTITQPSQLSVSVSGQNLICNGVCTGTALSSVTGGVGPYSFSWNTVPTTLTPDLSGLCAGQYTLTVTDNSGCQATAVRTVTEPNAIVVSTSVVNTVCAGNCTGSATATAIGGTGSLIYSWNTNPTQSTPTISNLCAGPYLVTVTDANGCSGSANANVNNNTNLTVSFQQQNPTCNGSCNGSLTGVVNGGTPPFIYTWSHSTTANGPTVNGLCAGVYTLTVTDANGCSFSETATETQPPAVVIAVNVTNLTCNSVCNGSVSTVVNGGQSPLTYLWTPNVSSGADASNLCAGTYQVRVTDANGCQAVTNATVSQPPPFNFNAATNNPSCAGSCNGSITTALTGGVAPYTYVWQPGGSTGTALNNLCAGSYSLSITDASGCTASNQFTLTAPAPLSATFTSTTSACGQCTGTANVTVTGGSTPYSYIWSDGSTTSAAASNLCSGVYSVNISDVNNCSTQLFVPISDVQGIASANVTTTPESCPTACDGTASVSPIGGTLPYTILWIPGGQVSSSISNQCGGSYFVQVSDSNNCSITTPYTISSPTPIVANPTVTAASCNQCNGSITLTPTGGTGPFSYSWLPNVSNSNSASNLCAGVYQVTITGANNCSQTFNINVNSNSNLAITATNTNATCFGGNDGSANVVVNGGTPPYSFLWFPDGQTTQAISGLSAGNYSVQVTDNSGCIITQSITISEPTEIGLSLIVVTDPLCVGNCNGTASIAASGGTLPYTYLWSNGSTTNSATGLCPGSYDLFVTDANGCQKTEVITVNAPDPILVTITTTNPVCGGPSNCNGVAVATASGGSAPYSYLWNTNPSQSSDTASSLCSGVYTVIVTDGNSCTATASASITQPSALTVSFTNVVNLVCAGDCIGSATALAGGGTPNGVTGYDYQWNDSNNSTTQTINDLCSGTYTVTITDDNNCTVSDSVTITAPPSIVLSSISTNISCFGSCDGQATVSVDSGGVAPYVITWNDPNNQSGFTATNLCPGNYTATVTDASNCSQTIQVTITEPLSITVSFTTTNTQCGEVCTGSAVANVTGGTSPYTYIWNNGSTAQQADSLCAGLNYVTVTDSSGCGITASVPIASLSGATVNVTGINPTCGTACNGSLSVSVSGSGVYSYFWLNTGDTINQLTNVCEGNYYVQVTDQNGCSTIDSISLFNSNIVPNEIIVNTVCGVCDGSITVNPSGGIAPFSYFWSNGELSNTTTNLCAGIYSVDITDGSGCTETFFYSIIQTNSTIIVTVSTSGLACFNDSNATATATVSGGLPPYTSYIWSTNPIQLGATATGLSDGTYYVSVTDANGCVSSGSVIIEEPGPILLSLPVSVDPLCSNSCDGSIQVTAAGGVLPYTFTWLPGVSSTTNTADNLCSGTYTAVLSDANGCQVTQTETLNQPPPITSVNTIVNTSCNNTCDGSVTMQITGGSQPFNVQLSPSSGSSTVTIDYSQNPVQITITGLCAGNVTVTITDTLGCTLQEGITIGSPAPLSLTTTPQDVTCSSACNGSATVLVSGGTAPYTYQWDDFNNQTTQTALSLCTGSYTVTVTDDNNCTSTSTVTINDNNTLTASITNVVNTLCYGSCEGAATGNGNGGLPPYTYQWNDDLLQTTQTAANLCAGTYICFVFDAAGCVNADTIVVSQPTPVVASATSTNSLCGNSCTGTGSATANGGTPPYSFQWNDNNLSIGQNVNGLCEGIYTVLASDANGCNTIDTVVITQPEPLVVSGIVSNSSCNNTSDGNIAATASGGTGTLSFSWQPGGFSGATLINASPQEYVLTVADANGCSTTDTFTLNADVYVFANAGTDTTVCIGDTISLNGGGGLSYSWTPSTAIIGNANISNPLVVINANTTLVLTVQTANCTATDQIDITVASGDSISAGDDVTIVVGGTAQLNATGSTAYFWVPSTGLSDANAPNPISSPSETIEYIVFANNQNGCISSDTVNVFVIPGINFPDGFSPNDDGFNDVWQVDNLNLYPETTVEIFNRWGQSIFFSTGYATPWDGKYEGKNLPVGTYYYVIDLKNGTKPLTGPVTIAR